VVNQERGIVWATAQGIEASIAKHLAESGAAVVANYASSKEGADRSRASRPPGLEESDLRKQVEAQTPLGRIGQPHDIAPVAVLLASSDTPWITGETLHVTGGTY
jgi:3-oxoacyl-[acyl-carrier protein] reductase